MSGHTTEEIHKEIRKYLFVFSTLLVLTVITVAISYLHLSLGKAILLALFVAIIKGALVCCYFMHLISERKIIYIFLGFTVFFFFGLLILPYAEYHSVPHGTEHTRSAVIMPGAHHDGAYSDKSEHSTATEPNRMDGHHGS